MDVIKRNNVVIRGEQKPAMLFAHGFGCDQNMWRFVAPAFEADHQVILFDHVGAGRSDLSAYRQEKYSKLEGYASDIVDIAGALDLRDAIFVGHSVSAMMGIIAANQSQGRFKALILVAPSPCYIDDGDYRGGFTKAQIDELLESLDQNHMGWSMAMAPVVIGNPDRADLNEELTNSFCRTDPEIAKRFARTTFLTDARPLLSNVAIPTLILQCTDDVIAPLEVGEYMHKHMPGSTLTVLEATGHCPNLSAPEETIAAIRAFI